jgi:hypothetical protein
MFLCVLGPKRERVTNSKTTNEFCLLTSHVKATSLHS